MRYTIQWVFLIFLFSSTLAAQQIDLSKFKTGDLADKRYDVFNLGEISNDYYQNYFVQFIGKMADYELICFVKTLGATSITVMEEIRIFLLKNGEIVQRIEEQFNKESSGNFEVFHDTFLQYVEIKHNWVEDEVGIMSFDPTNDFVGGLRFVLKNNTLTPIESLNKNELRIYRNLIFAKYGYVFKSEDLNSYFNKTAWYKPKPGIDVNSILSNSEKELIDYLKKLELEK